MGGLQQLQQLLARAVHMLCIWFLLPAHLILLCLGS
jgi:hypothetical protein